MDILRLDYFHSDDDVENASDYHEKVESTYLEYSNLDYILFGGSDDPDYPNWGCINECDTWMVFKKRYDSNILCISGRKCKDVPAVAYRRDPDPPHTDYYSDEEYDKIRNEFYQLGHDVVSIENDPPHPKYPDLHFNYNVGGLNDRMEFPYVRSNYVTRYTTPCFGVASVSRDNNQPIMRYYDFNKGAMVSMMGASGIDYWTTDRNPWKMFSTLTEDAMEFMKPDTFYRVSEFDDEYVYVEVNVNKNSKDFLSGFCIMNSRYDKHVDESTVTVKSSFIHYFKNFIHRENESGLYYKLMNVPEGVTSCKEDIDYHLKYVSYDIVSHFLNKACDELSDDDFRIKFTYDPNTAAGFGSGESYYSSVCGRLNFYAVKRGVRELDEIINTPGMSIRPSVIPYSFDLNTCLYTTFSSIYIDSEDYESAYLEYVNRLKDVIGYINASEIKSKVETNILHPLKSMIETKIYSFNEVMVRPDDSYPTSPYGSEVTLVTIETIGCMDSIDFRIDSAKYQPTEYHPDSYIVGVRDDKYNEFEIIVDMGNVNLRYFRDARSNDWIDLSESDDSEYVDVSVEMYNLYKQYCKHYIYVI